MPDDDYRGFLRRRAPDAFQAGAIVDQAGAVLGAHRGLADYTVGQRKGLGLAAGRRLYVLDLDPEANTVTVGAADRLERTRLVAESVNFIACDPPADAMPVEAKIRHSHVAAPATVRVLDPDRAEVVFEMPQRAITPGQSVVWYQGDLVIGGGIIVR